MSQNAPTDSKARKGLPMARGLLDYFPNALMEVARLSQESNEKHNPGEPLHWSKHKSNDHADCILRHMVDRGKYDEEDYRDWDTLILHDVKVAWRALAMCEIALTDPELLEEAKATLLGSIERSELLAARYRKPWWRRLLRL